MSLVYLVSARVRRNREGLSPLAWFLSVSFVGGSALKKGCVCVVLCVLCVLCCVCVVCVCVRVGCVCVCVCSPCFLTSSSVSPSSSPPLSPFIPFRPTPPERTKGSDLKADAGWVESQELLTETSRPILGGGGGGGGGGLLRAGPPAR